MQVYNFSAGPAMLPADVMAIARDEFCDFRQTGSGLIELSHRGPEFTAVIDRAVANIRELMGLTDDHAVTFIQGGASLQFAMVPMNLMLPGGFAEYADTGSWSSKAMKEAKLFGEVRTVASSKEAKYTHIPDVSAWAMDPAASYLHITSNNTIFGTQYHAFPEAPTPLVADMSSDIMSKVIDASKFGLIYAGAQKNIGPSGLTLVVVHRDLLGMAPLTIPTVMDYAVMAENGSMLNTPPTYGIYIAGLVFRWLKAKGGLSAMERQNITKAGLLYDCLDSTGFYGSPVARENRSRMNVPFTLHDATLDEAFLKGAKERGLVQLKGHRSVGGMRASIYNAMPVEGVQALVDYMKEFEKTKG